MGNRQWAVGGGQDGGLSAEVCELSVAAALLALVVGVAVLLFLAGLVALVWLGMGRMPRRDGLGGRDG